MRARNQVNGISVHAISGTRAVLLAMDATPEARRRLLGFAIKVRRRAEATEHWLHGFKFFRELTPSSQPGGRRSTLEHPIQSFLWGHYSVEPDQGYEYTIRPVLRPDSGNLSQLEFGRDVTVTIRTQGVNQGVYSVFFNRGALVSQTYASRFGNHPLPPHPDDPEDAATVWLSRDLLRAVLDFIEQARNARFSLRAAVHEFSYVPVLNAFSEAAARGADVRIIYAAGSERKAGGAISLTSTARVNEA
ncbi:MAG: hypothetical protein OEU26_12345, partial [Candidatus Tectomicrobia bacterium]|nr:hypothetical protein [Candidatus Tectomicrobia bacterium]